MAPPGAASAGSRGWSGSIHSHAPRHNISLWSPTGDSRPSPNTLTLPCGTAADTNSSSSGCFCNFICLLVCHQQPLTLPRYRPTACGSTAPTLGCVVSHPAVTRPPTTAAVQVWGRPCPAQVRQGACGARGAPHKYRRAGDTRVQSSGCGSGGLGRGCLQLRTHKSSPQPGGRRFHQQAGRALRSRLACAGHRPCSGLAPSSSGQPHTTPGTGGSALPSAPPPLPVPAAKPPQGRRVSSRCAGERGLPSAAPAPLSLAATSPGDPVRAGTEP